MILASFSVEIGEFNLPVVVLAVGALATVFVIAIAIYLANRLKKLILGYLSAENQNLYQKIIAPYNSIIFAIALLSLGDIFLSFELNNNWLKLLEILLAIAILVIVILIGYRIFDRFFKIYLLDIAVQGKINSELLLVTKFLGKGILTLTVVFIFAQTHNINLVGLIASLGVGGLAIAFAAQKTLEQLLGGIVLFIDRPFVLDDYIGLNDGTFGRVESIGLRSTKVRTSGKGTLVIVPNSSLVQASIENYSRVKKVITMIYLKFDRLLPEEEKALIRQVIIGSTKDIFGIDPRQSTVNFKDTESKEQQSPFTTAQINLFVLGSGEVSMELRRQLLDIARQNITQKLKEYGISFDLEDKMINVDSPITI
ncbi:MAG: mechanosensitive ion channel [Prochloraceae cyanobacterium]|nr:mechanosensitive ion channel [Prochloraceae cyanobacterium]